MKRVKVAKFQHHGEDYLVVSWPLEDSGHRAAALTSTEREVALLVAAGKTNRDIAATRGTSLRTVANQVAAILRKLDVPSRHHVGRAITAR